MTQYDLRHIVNISTSVPQQLGPLVAVYAVKLLNKALQLSPTSNGRRYAYELLTQNNLNNTNLNSLVELSFRIGWRRVLTREEISVESAADKAVEYALAAFTAEQVLTNPSLSAGLTPVMVSNVQSTFHVFSQEKASLIAITFMELGQHNNGNVGTVHHPGPNTVSSVLNMQPIAVGLSANAGPAYSAEWDQGTAVPNGPSLSQAGYIAPESVIQPTPSTSKHQESQLPQPVLFVAPEKHYYPSETNRLVYPSSITTCKGLHEMDALRHSRPYFNQLSISAQQALVGFAGTSFKMAEDVQNNDIDIQDRLTVEEIKVVTSTQDIFDAARQEHRRLGRRMKKPQYITRVLGVALNPVHTDSVFSMVQQNLYESDIRDIGRRLSVAVDCKDQDRPTPAQHERLITAAYIDRMLGRVTNDFLARGLRTKASLTTFADSIGDCSTFIQKNMPPDFNVLFQSFLNTLSENMKAYSTPSIVEGLKESMGLVDEDGEPLEDEGVVVVPIAHTVTYCNMTSAELEWTTSFRGTDIDPKVTPTLDQICFTLREDKARFSFKSSYDWLLTGDGETYLGYENPEIRGGYRLFPVTGLNINRLT